MIELHSLSASARRFKPKRVGRGNSSGKGTTAGRGTKGQRARTGGRNKAIRRSLKSLIERTPKTRGFRSRRVKLHAVDIVMLQQVFPEGKIITPALMKERGLVSHAWPGVKILGSTPLNKKLTVKAHKFSAAASAAIIKAGGTAVVIEDRVVIEPKKTDRKAKAS